MLIGTRLCTTIWWRVIQEGLRYKSTAEWALTKTETVGDHKIVHRKTDTAINRIKTVGACKLRIENTYGRKQNKALSDILSPHIPYKNLGYEQKEKI